MISNVHVGLPLATVNRGDTSSRNHIKVNRFDCTTKCDKYMGGVDSLGALFSVYRIDVRGKKRYWLSSINTIDVLKSVTFTVFKLVNPYAKIDFSAFTVLVGIHYVDATKVRRKLLPNIIYSRKRSWKGNAAVQENERNQGNHFVQKCSHKRCRVCHNQPRIWCPICKFDFCMEPCFKAFHMNYFVKV